jgi:hypothetical protein
LRTSCALHGDPNIWFNANLEQTVAVGVDPVEDAAQVVGLVLLADVVVGHGHHRDLRHLRGGCTVIATDGRLPFVLISRIKRGDG